MCGCMKSRRILISRRTAFVAGQRGSGARGAGARRAEAGGRAGREALFGLWSLFPAAPAAASRGHARLKAGRHRLLSAAPRLLAPPLPSARSTPPRPRCAAPPRTFLLHVHLLDLLAVQDLYGHLVPCEDVLRHLDLRSATVRVKVPKLASAACLACSPGGASQKTSAAQPFPRTSFPRHFRG